MTSPKHNAGLRLDLKCKQGRDALPQRREDYWSASLGSVNGKSRAVENIMVHALVVIEVALANFKAIILQTEIRKGENKC